MASISNLIIIFRLIEAYYNSYTSEIFRAKTLRRQEKGILLCELCALARNHTLSIC